MRQPSITAVLNAHREGMLGKPSIESLKRTVACAEKAGFEIEVIAVLDRPDQDTRDVIDTHGSKSFQVIEVDFGDLGKSRNHAVAAAKGLYVAFLDADDLWGVDWLAKAAQMASTRSDPVVWHPEISVYFGAARHLFCHVDMEDKAFRPAGLMIENYWTALSFAARDIYLHNPYPDTDLRAGFGFEDWGWNMQTIGRGIIHKIVPGTGHVIRRKEHSLAKETGLAKAVPRPSPYLRRYLARESMTP